ncbi:MAG: hypothetical protein ACYCZY_05920 [Lacisediminihabitans sp.]
MEGAGQDAHERVPDSPESGYYEWHTTPRRRKKTLFYIHNPVPLPREWWDDWLHPELVGDQYFVDAALQAALPAAGSLDIREVAPTPPAA